MIWGLLPIFWKSLQVLSPFYILGARILFSCIFCLVLLQLAKAWPNLKKTLHHRQAVALTALGALLISLNWGIYIWAVNNGHILDTSMGYYLNPLLVILISTVFFHEKMNALEWLSVGIASVGVCLMVIRYGEIPWIALLLASTFALYGAVKKFVKLGALISLSIETGVATLPALGYLLWMEQTTAVPHSGWLFFLMCCSGVVTAVPLLLYGYAVKTIPFATVGFFQFIAPTISMLLGLFLYGEQLHPGDLMTFGFIWVALAFYILAKILEMGKK